MNVKIVDYIKYNKVAVAKIAIVTILVIVGILIRIVKMPSDEIIVQNESTISDSMSSSESAVEVIEYIYVDLSGAVNKPGVMRVEAETRIYQAIELCGGLTKEADVININMAAKLQDEDKIYIPKYHEIQPITANNYNQPLAGAVGKGLININRANSEQLQELSGVGPSTAEKIIQYRQTNGSFKQIEDLKNVSGIGDKTFVKFKDKICI